MNWCPALGTVLANEEVIDGKYARRGGHPVERAADAPVDAAHHRLRRAPARTTSTTLDWPESHQGDAAQLDRPQRGRARCASRSPATRASRSPSSRRGPTRSSARPTWCSRPSTRWSTQITTPAQRARRRRPTSRPRARKSDLARVADCEGRRPASSPAPTPCNPVNGERDPDLDRRLRARRLRHRRDHGRARRTTSATSSSPTQFGLPIAQVVAAAGRRRRQARLASATASRSTRGFLDGLPTPQAKRRDDRVARERRARASARVNYKLRDWLFSRQRYWGEPFPVAAPRRRQREAGRRRARCRCCCPSSTTSSPTRRRASRRSRARRDWVETHRSRDRPPGAPRDQHDAAVGRRRAGTTCASSTRRTTAAPWSPEAERYWMPVDLYVGGAEHAVLHLLYARFWHKVLYDLGLVHTRRAVPEARSTRG